VIRSVLADPVFLLAAVVAVTLLGLSKGGLTGLGMAATPLLALTVPPLQAAAILLPILLVQDVISVWTYRRDWSASNLRAMLPGAVVGIAVAWLLAAYVSDAMLRLTVGLIGLAFVLNAWFVRAPAGAAAPRAWRGAFWGALSGFTSTLVHAGSPPFQIHMLPQRLPKLTFVGTNMMFFAAVNFIKIAPYLSLGHFSRHTLTIAAVLAPLAIVTNFLGIWLVRVMPGKLFYRLIYVLMFAVSAALTGQALVGLARG